MADDLDDGELWLPSDIVPYLGLRRHPEPLSIADDLPDRLAALSLLSPNPNLLLHNPIGPHKPAVPSLVYHRLVSAASLSPVGVRLAGRRPVYVLNKVDEFELRRARVWQMNHGGGLRRFTASGGERVGGTGVFFPRVAENEAKKKPSMEVAEQQKQRAGGGGCQGMSFHPPSSLMALPHEWTY